MDDISRRVEDRDDNPYGYQKQRDARQKDKMKGQAAYKPHLRKKKPVADRGMCQRRNRRFE